MRRRQWKGEGHEDGVTFQESKGFWKILKEKGGKDVDDGNKIVPANEIL